MPYIKTIPYSESEGTLKKIYERVKGPNNKVDNVLSIHSLRPHTLKGHMTLYKAVLHNSNNTLPKWYLELLGVFVSKLNACDYCFEHHSAGMKRLLQDEDLHKRLHTSIKNGEKPNSFEDLDEKQKIGMAHAEKLTNVLSKISSEDIDELRSVGFTDGEILELNQVVSYFNYVNRMVVGLGVDLLGDELGLSPNSSDNPDDWSHT